MFGLKERPYPSHVLIRFWCHSYYENFLGFRILAYYILQNFAKNNKLVKYRALYHYYKQNDGYHVSITHGKSKCFAFLNVRMVTILALKCMWLVAGRVVTQALPRRQI